MSNLPPSSLTIPSPLPVIDSNAFVTVVQLFGSCPVSSYLFWSNAET